MFTCHPHFLSYDFPMDIFPHTSIILLDFLLIYKGLKKISEYKSKASYTCCKSLLYFLAVCLLVLHFKVGFRGWGRQWAGLYIPVESFSFPVSNLFSSSIRFKQQPDWEEERQTLSQMHIIANHFINILLWLKFFNFGHKPLSLFLFKNSFLI